MKKSTKKPTTKRTATRKAGGRRKQDLVNRYTFLKSLQSLPHQKLDSVLPFLNEKGCSAIYECIRNVLENPGVKNRKSLVKKLEANKKTLRYLVSAKGTFPRKFKKTQKVGGAIISTILGVAIPLLLKFLSGK